MDIVEFFQASSGKWFSHRSAHQLESNQTEGCKSDLIFEALEPTDAQVTQLCQTCQMDATRALCGAKLTWSNQVDRATKKQDGSSTLVAIADADMPNSGILLVGTPKSAVVGRYHMGEDDVLTLMAEQDGQSTEERIWFASPDTTNVRLRTSIVKRSDGAQTASFFSEIRLGVAKPPES